MKQDAESLNLLIVFGGRSCEHAVSVTSTRSLLKAIAGASYQIQLLGITEQGQWRWAEPGTNLDCLLVDGIVDPGAGSPALPDLNLPGRFINTNSGQHFAFSAQVIFPVLHGTYGEDGTLQGLLEMFDIPYVGCGVLASANGMDKLFCKRLFADADIPQADYVAIPAEEWRSFPKKLEEEVVSRLDFPVFVKPANMGSSVGISKVHELGKLSMAIDLALEYDHKALVENGFENMLEIECAVLGNMQPEASVVGEIQAGADFYDYSAKYIEDTSSTIIPAELSSQASEKVRELAVKAFQAVDGSGLARVDFFVDPLTDDVYINEINTLPGFTPISMYPKLWAASGLPYVALIAKLIELAIERYEAKKTLKNSYSAPSGGVGS